MPTALRWSHEPDRGHFIVQFRDPIDETSLARLGALGAVLLDFVPERAYLVRLPEGTLAALKKDPLVRWVGPVQPAWKLSPELGTRPYADPSHRSGGRLEVTVDLFAGEPIEPVAEELRGLGIEVLATASFADTHRLTARGTRGQLEAAARIDAVAWIEETPEIELRNTRSRWVVQTGLPGATSVWDRGLHGEGQIVGHIDGPIYYKSCFFRDPNIEIPGPSHRKVIAYRAYGSGGEMHGTHTAGTLAGDSLPTAGSLGFSGIAYEAKISHTDIDGISGVDGSASNLYEFLEAAHLDGARVHSNSWGDDGTTSYTPLVRDVDRFAYDYEDSLIVFSASNSPWVRSPENAKNALAVGASMNGDLEGEFCSGGTGPTDDGRRKPEIFAPGCDIVSALNRSICGTTTASGTSMAAPAVAASALLVRQYFEEGWYPGGARRAVNGRLPSGALVKATLLNSAVDMTGLPGFPSEQEGWGRVLLEDALYFEGDARRLLVLADVRNARGLATGVSDHFTLEVTDAGQPLKVTLAFTEPPAALLAETATVNDLDLELVSPFGLRYRGNFFDTANGVSLPGGEPDPIDNVENVLVAEPHPGVWSVTVRGTAVNEGLQGYALVATGAVADGKGGALRYAEHSVDDGGALGNGNGVADPGETLTLAVSLLNLGNSAADSISGQLFSSRFDRASIGNGLAGYPPIPAGEIARSEPPHYTVTIAPDATCGEVLPFRIRSSHPEGSGDSTFGLQIGAIPTPGAAAVCQPLQCPDLPLDAGIGDAMRVHIEGTLDLHLTWPSVPRAVAYEVWRSADRDFGTAVLVGRFTATEYLDSGGLVSADDGYYRVRAVNACGWAGP